MNLSNLISIHEVSASPVQKVTKVGAGYIYVPGVDYRCRECWKFIPGSQRCAEFGVSDVVKSNGYCILWSHGTPVPGLKPTGAYTPQEAGYGEKPNGTKCKRCEYSVFPNCKKVDGKIVSDACCNNQEPK